MKSWKTLTGAIAGIIIFVLGALNVPVLGVNDWGQAVGTVAGLLGIGLFARDNDKSSEDVGAKS